MRRLFTSMACLLLLTGFAGTRPTLAAWQQQQQGASSRKGAAAEPADDAGKESCAACHASVVKNFGTNPHARPAVEHAGKEVTCESCHGPGKAHADSGGDLTKISRFDQASQQQNDETCLGCHAKAYASFESSAHAERGVGCISCHSMHAYGTEAHLLKSSETQLCYQCHGNVKPAFSEPFHHRVNEGRMSCSDCHDPHGTVGKNNSSSIADQNAVCTKCHSETAGPFAYEHPVVKAEGCVSCHSPHGSPNPRLLHVSSVNTLCLECHAATTAAVSPRAISPSGPADRQAAHFEACTTCHTQIHGSHASEVYLR